MLRQSLYDNEQQIQDHFAGFWAKVADYFSDNQYVLGYELLNEPWAGDVYRHPNQLEPREYSHYIGIMIIQLQSSSRCCRFQESCTTVQKVAFCYTGI